MRETETECHSIGSTISKKAIEMRRPLTCHFELTYRCNFHCKMCYIRMTDEQARPYGRLRTADEWVDMGRQIRDAGVLELTLTGGECTTFPEFDRLYTELYKMGFRLQVLSNAGNYTDKIRELFRKYPPYGVSITLYGASDETYEKVTGDPNGFSKVIDNIHFFQSINVPVGLTFTVIKQNVYDLPEIGKVCKKLQIPFYWITDIFPHRYNEAYSDALQCRLSPAERVCLSCRPHTEVKQAMQDAKEREKELIHFQMPEYDPSRLTEPRKPCNGSFMSAAIYWNGEMNTCLSMAGVDNVKPFDVGFEVAWKRLQDDHQKKFDTPNACWTCELQKYCVRSCPARQFRGTGSTMIPDPYVCRFAWLRKNMIEKVTI